MRPPRVALLAGSVLGAGAAAFGAYRATHPSHARRPDTGGRRRRVPVGDALFAMPAGVSTVDIDTSDGGSVHAVILGEGRPLVLLHGITLRSDVWAPQFHQLADRYRVIAVDLRGHGRSRAGSDGYGMAPLGADLALVLEHLDVAEAIVVGHSMGGMAVMALCGERPDVLAERVSGLVLVATAASRVLPPYVDRAVRQLLARGQARLDGGRPLPSRATVTVRLARLAFGDRPAARAVRIVAEMGQAMEPAALVPSLGGLLDHDAREVLRATRTPSLVVVGTRDLLTPVPAARRLARYLPDSDLVILPGAGHQLMQERPDELAELIDAFSDRLSGARASVGAAVAADGGPVTTAQVEPHPG